MIPFWLQNFINSSKELSPVLLDVYDSRYNFGTMRVSLQITNYRPILLLNFDYKIYMPILKNSTQKIFKLNNWY